MIEVEQGVVREYRGEDGAPVTFYSVARAAELSNLSQHHIRRLIRDKKLPHEIISGQYYIHESLVPIETRDYRDTTPFRDKVIEAVNAGRSDAVSDDEWQFLEWYASGVTLAEIGERYRKLQNAERALTRQRIHQLIQEAYEKIREGESVDTA